MTDLNLRPLTLGEILDRAFTIYRGHFLLFAGITAIPQILTLAMGLIQVFFFPTKIPVDMPGTLSSLLPDFSKVVMMLISSVVAIFVYALAQGGTIAALTEIYLGRTVSIEASLRRAWSRLGSLTGTIVLSGLVTFLAMLALVIPGLFVMSRLLVCLPVALVENRGPRDSVSRSWRLTQGFAGRSFLLILVYLVLAIGIGALLGIPLGFFVVTREGAEQIRTFVVFQLLSNVLVGIVVTPLLLIGTAVFYFDLRVRKEAFDLQFMMDPTSEGMTRGSDSGPSSLSPG